MQTEQLILQRLDSIQTRLDELFERQAATDELFEEMTPIAREALGVTIGKLDELDKQGAFAFVRELAAVGRRVVEGYSPEDVRQLGDAIVGILDVVRQLTRPEMLQIASDAATALRESEHAKPLGAFKAVRATRDADVQKGIGVLIEVLRRIGHGVNASTQHEQKAFDQKAKLAELLGPRKARMLPAAKPAPAPAPKPAVHATPPPPTGEWTRDLGETIAREQGVTLDESRWALIDAARADYATTKASPNIQRLTSITKITTRDLYQLFPKAPARTIAKIAGLPKPAGCL